MEIRLSWCGTGLSVVRLRYEQVRPGRGLGDRGRPGGVAGVGDDLAAQRQPQDQGRASLGWLACHTSARTPATAAEPPGRNSVTSTAKVTVTPAATGLGTEPAGDIEPEGLTRHHGPQPGFQVGQAAGAQRPPSGTGCR